MTEVKMGVYINPKTGKLKELSQERENVLILDEGERVRCQLFKITYPIVKRMSLGWPVFETYGDLKGYEYLGEL